MLARNTLAVVAALTSLAFVAPVSAQEISINTSVCEDAALRQQHCTSFQVDASLQQIADHFSSVNPNMSPEYLKRLNGWEDVSGDTVIRKGVFIRYT